MFPQEGETVPKVRFKGFEEEWICVLFKEIAYKTGIKNSENLLLESYSISNELGFIPQNEQFENGGTMSKADKRMYYIVSPKSFAYNPARINVGSLGYYQGERDVIVSSLYEVFKTSNIVDDLFLLYWFKTNMFKRMIEQYQEGGVRLYFFFDKLQKCQIKVPSLQEQQKIASYFCNLDKQISLQTQHLEKLKQIKAACLDKMFV
jgi:type I restriction enzyme S subunit